MARTSKAVIGQSIVVTNENSRYFDQMGVVDSISNNKSGVKMYHMKFEDGMIRSYNASHFSTNELTAEEIAKLPVGQGHKVKVLAAGAYLNATGVVIEEFRTDRIKFKVQFEDGIVRNYVKSQLQRVAA